MRDVVGAKAKTGQMLRGLVEQQGKKKKEMTDEFQAQVADAEHKMQAELRRKMSKRKRRGGLFGKILSGLAGFIPGIGPILSGLIGGISARKGIKDQQSHARGQIAKAQKYGLDPRFANTFLSSGAQDFKSKKKSMLDDLYAKTDVSSGDLLKATAMGGLSGYGIGKMASGFKAGFGDKMGGNIGKVDIQDISDVYKDTGGRMPIDRLSSKTGVGTTDLLDKIDIENLSDVMKDSTGRASLEKLFSPTGLAADTKGLTLLDRLKGGWQGAKGGFGDFTKLMGEDGKLSPENMQMLLMLLGNSADDIG
jgi:hypothetical protein